MNLWVLEAHAVNREYLDELILSAAFQLTPQKYDQEFDLDSERWNIPFQTLRI